MRAIESTEEVYWALECAAAWGLLEVPEGVEVLVSNFHFSRDKIVRRGVVVAVGAAGERGMMLADCDFDDCTAAGVVDALLPLIRAELGEPQNTLIGMHATGDGILESDSVARGLVLGLAISLPLLAIGAFFGFVLERALS
jgi:hypothetical protein